MTLDCITKMAITESVEFPVSVKEDTQSLVKIDLENRCDSDDFDLTCPFMT